MRFFLHVTSTKVTRASLWIELKINVVRGLWFERIIKFEKLKQFFENLLIEAIETLMKSKVTAKDVFLGSEPPSRRNFQTR